MIEDHLKPLCDSGLGNLNLQRSWKTSAFRVFMTVFSIWQKESEEEYKVDNDD